MLKIFLFGTPRISLYDKPIKISRRKALALFCYLAMRDQPISRDALSNLLWSDYDPERARADLRVSLCAINKAIGDDWLVVDRDTIRISPEKPIWLDVLAFQTAVQIPLTHQHHPDEVCMACLPHYEAAYQLYTDDFLAGFTVPNVAEFEDWQLMQTEMLRLSYQQVLRKLVLGYSALQQLDAAMQYGQRWLGLDLFNEEAHRYMMCLQAWTGNKTGALQQYLTCQQILLDELGVEPSDETNQLYQDLKDGILPSFPIIYYDEITPTTPHNLPPQPNPFRGRSDEVAQLIANLKNDDCRLLTLTGLGGSGKTRLACHTARQVFAFFPDGIFFVPLVGVFNRYAILTKIADAIGFQFVEGDLQETQLFTYLSSKQLLLILDNFEHLLEHVSLVEQILQQVSTVKLLITSRIPLNLKAEWVFTVDRMTEGAEQLFLDSALRVEQRFELNQSEIIQQICEQLAGLPLAIELAATWVSVLSLPEILQEVQQNKEALETNWHDIPERQRSLQDNFEYSWRLLNSTNQQALASMAIFSGNFSYPAAKAVADVRISSLATLAAQGLIKRNAQGLYDLHILIRQFALNKLRQSPEQYMTVVLAFIRYVNQLLVDHLPELRGEGMLAAKNSLQLEFNSIRAACMLALEHQQAHLMLDALPTLALFYDIQGYYQEALMIFQQFSHAKPHHDLLSVRAKIYWGRFARLLGDYSLAKTLLLQVLEQARMFPYELASAYIQLYHVLYNQDHQQALSYAQKALEIFDELNLPLEKGMVLRAFAEIKTHIGLTDEAILDAQQALNLLRPLGDIFELAPIYRTLSRLYIYQGNYDDALVAGQKSVALYKQFDFKNQLIRSQTILASIYNRTSEYEQAQIILQEAIALAEQLQLDETLMYALLEYGTNAYYRKTYQDAIDALEQALQLSQKLNMEMFSNYLKINLSNVLLDMAQYDRAKSLILQAVPAFEAAKNYYGVVVGNNMLVKYLLATQQIEEAHILLKSNIHLANQYQLTVNWLTAICYLGELYYMLGQSENALRLIDFVIQHDSTESAIREEAIDYRDKITLALGKEQVKKLLMKPVDLDMLFN